MTRSQVSRLLLLTGGAALTLGLAIGWLLAGIAIDAAGVGALFWLAAAVMGGVAIAGLWSVHRLMRGFVVQVRDLADAGRIILAANPDYRARGGGHPDVAALAAVINALGAQLQELQQARAVAIQQARSDLEEERNLLAALMAELTDGVLVCNLDGQILLYNRSARALLDNRADANRADANRADAQAGYVGLGRSVFSVLDRDALTHALDQVRARSTTDPVHEGAPGGEQMATTSLVATASNGRLLRLRLAPFAGAAGALRGYVLTLQDISEGIERSHRRDVLLQTLSERLRASVASMRAAIETLEQFPMLTATQQSRLQRVIRDEVTALSNNLNDTLRAYDSDLRAQWRLEEMHGSDLLWSIVRHLERRHGVTVQSDASDDALWLKVDSYTLLQGVSHLAAALAADFGIAALTLRLAAYEPAEPAPGGDALKAANRPSQIANHPAFAALDIGWHAPGDDEAWQRWKARAYVVDATDGVLTLAEVAERHGGEVWFQRNGGQALAYFRLLLPRAGRTDARAAALSPAPGPRLESRPEYYDFDLFHQPGQRPELDERPLRDLVCTVFDTETTGLSPEMDAIVSIGALRIVNGRMLRQEVFEQLVDPRRPIPEVAINVHGITDGMVRGQPGIEVVLPRFHKFAEETVLVGHNLAFDLRMFQVQEDVTQVVFANPVLDTLLLSAVIHPEESNHSLEGIALRLGVTAAGRHTALGDAIMTGEVFLRMIPLLEQQGIVTLRQARTAAERTYFARLKY
jgi:DNA polymerase-3 subunit epsilon